MRKNIQKTILLLGLGVQAYAQQEEDCCCCPTTEISCPCFSGGVYAEGSWLYLRPTATDADLAYGSLITLTVTPSNLNALLLEVEPSYHSGYELNLGYRFSCSNQAVNVNYFSLHAHDEDKKSIKNRDQIIQNFLGASYSDARADSKQKVDQIGAFYRADFCIDRNLDLQPFLGVIYADIRRDLDVKYQDLVFTSNPTLLTGEEKSKYWGVGPFFGTEFSFPLFCNFGITGNLGVGVLFGRVKSKVSAESFQEDEVSTFFADDSDNRIVTNLSSDIGLVYCWPFNNNWGLEFQAGYRVEYYFKPIDRINPFRGFVVNPNPFPVKQTSNLSLGGAYVLVSLNQSLLPFSCNTLSCCPLFERYGNSGPFFNFTSFWLDPTPTNKDLVYAILTNEQDKEKDEEANPSLTWAPNYEFGYRFCQGYDLQGRYFHLEESDSDQVTAKDGEGINSVNASGDEFVVFASAKSKVKYSLDQWDGSFGKYMQIFCGWNLHTSLGLRYLQLDRKLTNAYFGGAPSNVTESKFPLLKSRFEGIGPLFTLEPDISLFYNFSLIGRLGVAFLVGEIKSTLDQVNFGTVLAESSNDLRTPHTPTIVPVFEGRVGLKYDTTFYDCISINVEGGYQYFEYYRGIRLLLPTTLTGLEQINSNLKLLGPYFTVGLRASF